MDKLIRGWSTVPRSKTEYLYGQWVPFILVAAALLISIISCRQSTLVSPLPAPALPSRQTSAVSPPPADLQRETLMGRRIYAMNVNSSRELIARLHEFNLWGKVQEDVPSVIIEHFPADLALVDLSRKKKAFVRALLPVVMVVREEVMLERQRLLTVINELGGPRGLTFYPGRQEWQTAIAREQVLFINELCRKYRTEDAEELLNRVNVLPVSLMLAQGAIESSWGSSRFANQANNLFGMWTWGKKGLVPARRAANQSHKIAIYDSVLDSVRAYMLTINRVGAYADLRRIRRHSMDAAAVAEGLLNYSARKGFYVTSLQSLIKNNNLESYDNCRLVDAG
ncbi:MAG TPA: glucosaminidase [Desulfobacterales bacterium]|nr:glucosaminidase [Desulfobacterales bacterium]